MPSSTTLRVIGQRGGVPSSVLVLMAKEDALDRGPDFAIFPNAHGETPSVTNASTGSAAGRASTGAAFART